MRRWSRAALAGLLLAPAGPARAGGRVYDPEIALLLLDVQKQSVNLVGEEMLRRAESMNLGAMRVLLPRRISAFSRQVRAEATLDSDIVEDYRRAVTDMSPSDAPEIDALFGEIRRYHDLKAGPPLARVPLTAPADRTHEIIEEAGPGADVASGMEGTPLLDQTAASAERRFGAIGPFLRRRKWNLDFYLGSFADLAAHYRKLGYRRAYRLRAPYVSFGRSAYVLSPEPGLLPRMVYCEFYGQDLFLDTRAQWAELTAMAKEPGPAVTTLTCPDCAWTLPGVLAMRSLLATVPYAADAVIVGYDGLFADAWKKRLLGTYENDYWRLDYYRGDAGVAAVVRPRHTDYGEILAASLTPLVRRGAKAVYYAGLAAVVDAGADAESLAAPTDFATFDGPTIPLRNALAGRRGKPALFSGLPSPLLATKEWLAAAKSHGVIAIDVEMTRIAEEADRWARPDGSRVDVGIGAVLGPFSSLHAEEDSDQLGSDSAKSQFRDAVLAALKDEARGRSR